MVRTLLQQGTNHTNHTWHGPSQLSSIQLATGAETRGGAGPRKCATQCGERLHYRSLYGRVGVGQVARIPARARAPAQGWRPAGCNRCMSPPPRVPVATDRCAGLAAQSAFGLGSGYGAPAPSEGGFAAFAPACAVGVGLRTGAAARGLASTQGGMRHTPTDGALAVVVEARRARAAVALSPPRGTAALMALL